jgi:hypothetical protein
VALCIASHPIMSSNAVAMCDRRKIFLTPVKPRHSLGEGARLRGYTKGE